MIDVVDKERQGLDPKLASLLDDETEPKKGYLYCAACSHVITRQDEAIEVNGTFEHFLTNPHGFSFRLGCYREALGSSLSGDPTSAESWFPGFEWRYASCAECTQHLGWYFDRAEAFFYGLILDRIQSD